MQTGIVAINASITQYDMNNTVIIQSQLERGSNYHITANRQIALVQNGGLYQSNLNASYTVDRDFNDIINDTITLPPQYGGITLTMGQIGVALEMATDIYAQQDRNIPGTTSYNAAIQAGLPAITSTLTVTGAMGTPFTYIITAVNNPTSFNATGLPAGLVVTTTGVITGTPTVSGSFNIVISATNTLSTCSATLVMTC